MKIAVAGLGYVGLSNAVFLAQHNTVVAVDINQSRVDMVNARKSPIVDPDIADFLTTRDLDLTATTDSTAAFADADYIIVATPTNYDERSNYFDTSSVEAVVVRALEANEDAQIVIKSTIPVGFVEGLRFDLDSDNIMFSPEFLR